MVISLPPEWPGGGPLVAAGSDGYALKLSCDPALSISSTIPPVSQVRIHPLPLNGKPYAAAGFRVRAS